MTESNNSAAPKKKKTSPNRFAREVRNEASKITWTTRKETIQTTIMVFIMVTLVAIFLFFADQIISWIIQMILGIGN